MRLKKVTGVSMPALLHISPASIDLRIRELGLKREGLISAVRAAAGAVASCTSNNPPISRGWLAWCEAVVRLREEFGRDGWVADDTANFSTIIDEAAGVRLAVVNTDDGAGNPALVPTNRSRRGQFSKQAIESNQLSLPFLGWEVEPVEARRSDMTTWYLCIHAVDDKVRAELSLPTSCEGGIIGGWRERIMLVSSDGDLAVRGSPIVDEGPDFEVRISRR
jgi:hypothetical protein